MHDIESTVLAELIDRLYHHLAHQERMMSTLAEGQAQLANSLANLQAREAAKDQTIVDLRAQLEQAATTADTAAGDALAATAQQIDAIA
jgi:aldehyde:ferredoxin oxidoreductase